MRYSSIYCLLPSLAFLLLPHVRSQTCLILDSDGETAIPASDLTGDWNVGAPASYDAGSAGGAALSSGSPNEVSDVTSAYCFNNDVGFIDTIVFEFKYASTFVSGTGATLTLLLETADGTVVWSWQSDPFVDFIFPTYSQLQVYAFSDLNIDISGLDAPRFTIEFTNNDNAVYLLEESLALQLYWAMETCLHTSLRDLTPTSQVNVYDPPIVDHNYVNAPRVEIGDGGIYNTWLYLHPTNYAVLAVEWDLDGLYERFTAGFGFGTSNCAASVTGIQTSVYVDDVLAHQSGTIVDMTDFVHADLDVTGAMKLKITVSSLGLYYCDQGLVTNPMLTCAGAAPVALAECWGGSNNHLVNGAGGENGGAQGEELVVDTNQSSVGECDLLCKGTAGCVAYSWASSNGNVCSLWDSVVASTVYETNQIMCSVCDKPL